MNSGGNLSISAEVAEQAMHWHLELQEQGVSEATLAAWMNWRQSHPAHEQAWQRAETFAQRMREMRAPNQRPLVHATLRPMSSRRTALKQLGVLLAAGASTWYLKDSTQIQDWSADYHSRIGEQRRLMLVDGSKVQLNTDSAISADTDAQTRRIRLLRGEILVSNSTKAGGRLLSVDTAQGRLESSQAQFNVRQLGEHSQVSVHQGTLLIKPGALAHQPALLKAGEQASFTSSQVFDRHPVALSPPAWSQGMLVAQGQRLDEFIEDLRRYRRGHLACDPSLAGLQVSGTFPLGDTEKVITAVADTLQLDVQHFTRYWVTLKPRSV